MYGSDHSKEDIMQAHFMALTPQRLYMF